MLLYCYRLTYLDDMVFHVAVFIFLTYLDNIVLWLLLLCLLTLVIEKRQYKVISCCCIVNFLTYLDNMVLWLL